MNGDYAATLNQLKEVAVLSKAEIGGIAMAAGEAIEEAYQQMAAKTVNSSLTIHAADWQQQSDGSNIAYPFYCDILVTGIEATDCVGVNVIDEASATVALDAGICERPEVMAGNFRLRTKTRPRADIAIEFGVFDGKWKSRSD